jgi:hypothetical protein
MKKLILALASLGLGMTGPAAGAGQPDRGPAATSVSTNAAQARRRQPADVQLSVTDATGRTVAAASLPPQERQQVTSLQSSLQQWGNQQAQRVSVTIRCSYPPLRCEITISF